jgi:hypothetical protein
VRDASPRAETEKLAGILAAQQDGRLAGATTTSSWLPGRNPWAWNLTTTPGTTEAGPLTLGTPSALACPATAEHSTSATDAVAARRRTGATLAQPQKAIL